MGGAPENKHTITLSFPTTGYSNTFFFNEFYIEEIQNRVFVFVWHESSSRQIIDRFAYVLLHEDIQRLIQSFKDFIPKTKTTPKIRKTALPLGLDFPKTHIVRFIRGCVTGDSAEQTLYFLPMTFLIDNAPDKNPMMLEPVAVLMSDKQTQVDIMHSLISIMEKKK